MYMYFYTNMAMFTSVQVQEVREQGTPSPTEGTRWSTGG